ncbi:MAG: sugar phosphate isomerase/epimerase [Oscillospiraceae bacterium]
MKYAFSTLGCPDWGWKDIFSTAKDLGFDGIEVRGIANELYTPKAKAFDADHIEKNIAKLKESKIEIAMLTTGISVGEEQLNQFEQAQEYIKLASKLTCKYIRIMISSRPHPEKVDLKKAINLYTQICEYGIDYNVCPLIETNGVLANSKEMLEFINSINCENKGVLWDVHHPYRFFGESPQYTYSLLGDYIKYVHVKDSILGQSGIEYKMIGYGDVPVLETLKLLKSKDFDSYITLEWVKRWNPDLDEPGIVFEHFMSYIKTAKSQM